MASDQETPGQRSPACGPGHRFPRSAGSGDLCLGEIHYLDAVIADDLGHPKTITNAICMHEEDTGVLWKHSDMFTGSAETRRQRRIRRTPPRWRPGSARPTYHQHLISARVDMTVDGVANAVGECRRSACR